MSVLITNIDKEFEEISIYVDGEVVNRSTSNNYVINFIVELKDTVMESTIELRGYEDISFSEAEKIVREQLKMKE